MTPFHVYLIEDSESHWYVAPSAQAALDQFARDQGSTPEEYPFLYPETTVEQLADDHILTITDRAEDSGLDEDVDVKHPCRVWAAGCDTVECISTTYC